MDGLIRAVDLLHLIILGESANCLEERSDSEWKSASRLIDFVRNQEKEVHPDNASSFNQGSRERTASMLGINALRPYTESSI